VPLACASLQTHRDRLEERKSLRRLGCFVRAASAVRTSHHEVFQHKAIIGRSQGMMATDAEYGLARWPRRLRLRNADELVGFPTSGAAEIDGRASGHGLNDKPSRQSRKAVNIMPRSNRNESVARFPSDRLPLPQHLRRTFFFYPERIAQRRSSIHRRTKGIIWYRAGRSRRRFGTGQNAVRCVAAR
jgi:hypothetical protein